MGKHTWGGWQTSAADAPQPTSILYGANIKNQTSSQLSSDKAKQSVDSYLISSQNSLGVEISEELVSSFDRVLKGLRTKSEDKEFFDCCDSIESLVDESLINGSGERLGEGIPIHFLQNYLSDQNLAQFEGLDELESSAITDSQRIQFARNVLSALDEILDADLCPGYWTVEIRNQKDSFYLGYSITGYSFSGIQWAKHGAYLNQAEFEDYIRKSHQMIFNGIILLDCGTIFLSDLTDKQIIDFLWINNLT